MIENKVKASKKLVTLDLEQYYDDRPIKSFDIKDMLFKGLILKEQEFRESLEAHNWQQYKDAYVSVHCSSDAIISKWAYMLIAQYLVPHAADVFQGTPESTRSELYRRQLDAIDWAQYDDKFVILKGCSSKDKSVPDSAYLFATKKLVPRVKKLMYGEACSNVPVYRKSR